MFGHQQAFGDNSLVCATTPQQPSAGISPLQPDNNPRTPREDRLPSSAEIASDMPVVRAVARVLEPSDIAREGLERAVFVRSIEGIGEPSGDFCDTFALDDGVVALVIGDVSGHGREAAAHVPEVRAMLRLLLYSNPDPGEALTALNSALCETRQANPLAPSWFVCASIAVIDSQTGHGRSACAGAEPPMIVSTKAMHRSLQMGGLPAGAFEDARYFAGQFTFTPSELLIMATDGVFEAGSPYRPLGSERLLKWVNGLFPARSLNLIGQMLMDEVESYTKGEFTDDIALLVARLL